MSKIKTYKFKKTWWDMLRTLNTATRDEVFRAINLYYFENYLPDLSPMASTIFSVIKPEIDESKSEFERVSAVRAESGKRHSGNQYTRLREMEQMEQNGTNGTKRNKCSNTPAENQQVSIFSEQEMDDMRGGLAENTAPLIAPPFNNTPPYNPPRNNYSPLGEKIIKSEVKKFRKPTLEEVTEYCNARGNQIDPQHFIDHYEEVGWMVGRNHMKDWKAAVRTWERQQHLYGSNRTYTPATTQKIEPDYEQQF